ncbi:MAG TPA: ABC transporter permease subunit [Pseudonocardiaceae bacterium]|jgi:sulfonate transport system permease protein|nr:ABC transporter permease subunit [Pseudonocardiaceae bacterium]
MSTIDIATPVSRPVPAEGEKGRWLLEAATLRHNRKPWLRLPRWARRLGGPLLLLVVWQLLGSLGVASSQILAPPSAVLRAAWDLSITGELGTNLLASLIRAGEGLAVGVPLGVLLAVVAGLFRIGDDLVDSSMQILRGLPVLGLLPLVIIWFGVGELPKVALVAFGALFPVYVNTYAGIRGVDNRLVESGRAFGLGRSGLIRYVILPGAVPGFLVGLRFALTASWLILVIAEQLNATSGIGYLMNQAQSWYRTDIIVLGLLIYGLLGLASDGLVRLLERRLLVWRRGFDGG